MSRFLIFIFAILGRVLPHPSGLSPLVALTLSFANRGNKIESLFISLSFLLITDFILIFTGHFYWGEWVLFTYSGLAIISLIFSGALTFSKSVQAGIFYWVWTNFGTWLESGIYNHTFYGLTSCYTAALPFLGKEILGDLLWTGCFLLIIKWFLVDYRSNKLDNYIHDFSYIRF